MGGMDLILTLVLVTRLSGPPGLLRTTNNSWTHRYSEMSYWKVRPALNTSCPPPTPPLYMHSMILQWP